MNKTTTYLSANIGAEYSLTIVGPLDWLNYVHNMTNAQHALLCSNRDNLLDKNRRLYISAIKNDLAYKIKNRLIRPQIIDIHSIVN